MSSAHPSACADTTANLACFEVRGQIFALEVSSVREIVRAQSISALPNAPCLIEGVVDLRGAVIPVVDLARLLGQEPQEDQGLARIVVLEARDLVLGLRVDAATDVLTIPSERLEEVPQLASQSGYTEVRSVIRRDGEAPVMVLCLNALIERVLRSSDLAEDAAS